MNIKMQLNNNKMSLNFKSRINEYIKSIINEQGKYSKMIDSNEAQIYEFSKSFVKIHRRELKEKKFFERESNIYKLLSTIKPIVCPNFEIDEELKIIKTDKYDYDLWDKVKELGFLEDINTIRYIFKQIVDKLYVLHSNNIYHGDLKLENIVIKGDYLNEDFELRFIDFSFSNQLANKTDKLICSRGTPYYAAPEIGNNLEINPFAADIWSLGCCFHILISGNFLYDNRENYNRLINETYNFYSIHNESRKINNCELSEENIDLFARLIYGCCNIKSSKRWSIEEVKDFIDKELSPPIIDFDLNYVDSDEEFFGYNFREEEYHFNKMDDKNDWYDENLEKVDKTEEVKEWYDDWYENK